ncbi:MAG: hypothetical protein IKH63_09165 [Prevotella sp.]|nr:hypothetical protein [Prevotella sp.]
MRIRHRRFVAWLLLSVFIPMMALSILHHHHEVVNDDVECVQCAHHLPHSGHISWHSVSLDNCVLCQFNHVPYDYSQAETWSCFITTIHYFVPVCQVDIPLATISRHLLRAPPHLI